MKKLLKFAPICALLLAIVALVLVFATHGMTYETTLLGQKVTAWYSGVAVLFGKGQYQAAVSGLGSGTADFDGKGAWNAMLAFIFLAIALVALLVSVLTIFVKIKALEKFGGLIALVAGGLLLVAGIFLFFTVPAFAGANEWNNSDGWALGGGWVVAAILAIVAGAVSAFPAVLALVEKK